MKAFRSILTATVALALLGVSARAITLPVSEDSSTSGNAFVAKTAGRDTTLHVSAARQGLIRFEAGAFADSMSAGDVAKARLVIFISSVTAPGDLTLHRVTEDWSEHGATVPAYDAAPLATIPQSSVVAKQFIIVDVTAAVQAWLREPGKDFGFAIVASGGTRVLLGAKEGPAAGHPAQLQIETGDAEEGGRTRASATAPIGNFVTNADIVNGTIKGKKLKAGTVTGTQLGANLTLGGTTTGAFAGSGAGLTALDAAQLTGAIPDARLSANVALRSGGNTFTGNQIFNSGSIGIGIAVPTASLHVAGAFTADALRLGTTASGSNVIGGFSGNAVSAGVAAATIAGGGQSGSLNQVLGAAGTVGGGLGNTAGASGQTSATVGGGTSNTASASDATVGGGSSNTASGTGATVPGGTSNTAAGSQSFAAGNNARANHAGSFVWADSTGTNFASTAADQFLIRATGNVGITNNNPFGKLHIEQPLNGAPTLHLQGGEAENIANPTRSGIAFSYFSGGVAKHFITTNHSSTPANNLMSFWLNNNTTLTTADTPGNGTTRVLTLSGNGKVSMTGNGTSNATPAGHVVLIRDVSGSDVNGLAIQSPFGATHLTSDNFITFFNSTGTSIGSIEGNGAGSVQLGGAGSDYAEYLPKADPAAKIEAAEIVGVRDGRIVGRGEEADQFMVVTGQAIVAGNRPNENEADLAKRSLVSFIGQVPVRVRGVVKSGDFILAAEKGDGTGIAMAVENIPPSAMHRIVGRAWEGSDEAGLKTVNTAVGLDQTSLVVPALEKLDRENRELRARLAALEARLDALDERPARTTRASLEIASPRR